MLAAGENFFLNIAPCFLEKMMIFTLKNASKTVQNTNLSIFFFKIPSSSLRELREVSGSGKVVSHGVTGFLGGKKRKKTEKNPNIDFFDFFRNPFGMVSDDFCDVSGYLN